MLTLFCVVVGEGRPFCVKVDPHGSVHQVKCSIQAAKGYQFAADEMDLYVAKKNGAWLNESSAKAMTRSGCDKDLRWMDPTASIDAPTLFGSKFRRKDGHVHVLVTLPRGALSSAAFCPKVSVWELLQSNALPDGVEFFQVLEQPLGFKIPVTMAKFVAKWPDVFTFGDAEYGSALSLFLENPYYDPYSAASEVTVTSTDSMWLHLVHTACGCLLYRDQADPSSCRPKARPDVVIATRNVMVGKCVAKADDFAMNAAREDLTANLAPAAHRMFPRGLTSIPAWTTCATRIELHNLSLDPSTKSFKATLLKTYFVLGDDHRMRFIVDLFKIMQWISTIKQPNAIMHLIPGIRTETPSEYYVTWVKVGLVKEFQHKSDEIDMALIQRIYKARLSHVERGWCSGKTVTITSVGQTLSNAIREHKIPHAVILKQVRAALDELHSIGVAHCDVRADNVFVLEEKRVILGSLEDCRLVDALPPYQPEDKPCKTALELEEHQLRKFEDELAEMCT